MVSKYQMDDDALCHPLCECTECLKLRREHESRSTTQITLSSVDLKGRSAVAVAARVGSVEVRRSVCITGYTSPFLFVMFTKFCCTLLSPSS